MMRLCTFIAVVLSATITIACSDEGGGIADATVAFDASTTVDACAVGGAETVLFFNRNGGDYTAGPNDPANNVASVIAQGGTAEPWPHGDTTWDDMLVCVAQRLSRYDVTITDVEPTSGDYNELVFTASAPAVFGLSDGITSNNPFSCGLIQSGIVVLFSGLVQNDSIAHCDQATFSIGKLVGLDNIMNCEDPVTFLESCGAREYQDVDSDCGDFVVGDCSCGGTQENHHQMMVSRLGASCQ